MKVNFRALIALMVVLAIGQAYADEYCNEKYKGKVGSLPEADAKFLANALSSIKSKKRDELLAFSQPKILLVRRYLSGGIDSRGGNLWVEFTHKQIDKNLVVHIPPMKLPEILPDSSGKHKLINQPAQGSAFSGEYYYPETDGTSIILDRTVCGEADLCQLLPFGYDTENLIYELMLCSGNTKSAFVFKDGLLITGMELMPWPIGTAFFFTKTPSGYMLAALIEFG